MQSAERGLERLQTAVGKTGREARNQVLKSLQIESLERVDNLETLKRIVLELERLAENRS
jgi:hypothetical protein